MMQFACIMQILKTARNNVQFDYDTSIGCLVTSDILRIQQNQLASY